MNEKEIEYDNSGQAYEADINAITRWEAEITEEQEQEEESK